MRATLGGVDIHGPAAAALAILFALASAALVAWGTVARHRTVLGSGGSVLSTALRNPLWWWGALAAVVAYLAQLVALAFGSVLVVQPILVLSLLFTLVVAAVWQGRRPDREASAWSLLLGASVAVLVLVGRPRPGQDDLALRDWAPWLLGGIGLVAGLIAGAIAYRRSSAWLLGTATGVLYGLVAPVAKTAVDVARSMGWGAALLSWSTWLLVGLIVAGAVLQQYSFSAGPLEQSLPAMTVAEPLVAMLVGYFLLGETFAVTDVVGWTVIVLSVIGMVGGAAALSLRTAN